MVFSQNTRTLILSGFCLTADTWPQVFDDSGAREQWGWHHEHDIHSLVNIMFSKLKKIYSTS